jgi:hypothetical protein
MELRDEAWREPGGGGQTAERQPALLAQPPYEVADGVLFEARHGRDVTRW